MTHLPPLPPQERRLRPGVRRRRRSVGPGFLQRAAFAATAARRGGKGKVLVCVFQRGAADGLSMVAPFGDPYYYKLRKEIALPAPATASATRAPRRPRRLLRAAPARSRRSRRCTRRGELAVVHACGSPQPDAVALRRAGPHGGRRGEGQVDARRVAEPAGRAAGQPGAGATPFRAVVDDVRRPADASAATHDVLAIPDLKPSASTAAAPRASASAAASAAAGSRGCTRPPSTTSLDGAGKESFDAIAHAEGRRPVAATAPPTAPTTPATRSAARCMQVAQLDQGRRRRAGRVRRGRRLGHPRQPGRRQRPARRQALRLRPRRSPRSTPTSATGWPTSSC